MLRKNYPCDQLFLLQILANEGISTKVVFRELNGETKYNFQFLWDKNVSQINMRKAIRIVLGKLKLKMRIWTDKNYSSTYGQTRLSKK